MSRRQLDLSKLDKFTPKSRDVTSTKASSDQDIEAGLDQQSGTKPSRTKPALTIDDVFIA
jgi:hypothetical protein